MVEKTWFEAFEESVNVIFTDDDFKRYLAEVKSSYEFYKRHLGKGTRVLDLGCGLGMTSIPLSTFGYVITGLDSDMRVIQAARQNADRFGKQIEFVHGDVFDIDNLFQPDSFEACISGGLLEHFNEDRIRDLVRKQLVLAPKVIASMPVCTYPGEVWDDGMNRNLWSEKYWLETILPDFNIVEHEVEKSSEAIGGFMELTVVIDR